MIIRKYGILLREVQREDLEMIRQYRNSDVIKNTMIYRKTISREQQKKWFEEIMNFKHAYFIIYKGDEAMGLINGKNIDHVKKTSEGGIFIWNPACSYETSVLASIVLNDWNFIFNNFNLNYAEVLKSNKQAISYNKAMGYKISERIHDNSDVLWMTQNKEDYLKFRARISKLKIDGYDLTIPLQKEDLSIEEEEVETKKAAIARLPEAQRKMFEEMMKER